MAQVKKHANSLRINCRLKMWPFSSRKYKTLSHAVLAGDLSAVRIMLAQGCQSEQV